MNFLSAHICMFADQCQFAHHISEVSELIIEIENKKIERKNKKLFHNLGMGPSLTILSFFTPEEIVHHLRRVNKEALVLCKQFWSTRVVKLEKITLRSVKFFERTQELRVSKESLNFFAVYKDEFFQEILNHYKLVRTFTVNLNFLFDD